MSQNKPQVRQWTTQQQQAISSRGGSLLISAGAGSGKTAVLTERCVGLIFDSISPTDADRLLVLTYTKAAAGEMKERIAAKIRGMQVPGAHGTALQRQLILLEKANISTVHAFCQGIIKENFQALGVDAQFRIAEDQELEIWQSESAGAVIEREYAAGQEVFLELVELLSAGRDDAALINTITSAYKFVRAHPFYADWLSGKIMLYSGAGTVQDSPWGQILLEESQKKLHFAAEKIDSATEQMNGDARITAAYGDCIFWYQRYLGELLALVGAERWDETLAKLGDGFVPPAFASLTKYVNLERKAFVTACRDEAKKTVEAVSKYFCCTEAEFTDDMHDLSPKIQKLFELVMALDTELFAKKISHGALDYADLEHLTISLLMEKNDNGSGYKKTAYAGELSKRFEQVFIDEYQDTNAVQEMIFSAVSQNGENLFMVGDIKQSIYKFRQAKPEIFLEKKDSFLPYGKGFPAQISLMENFRSRSGVTGAINFLFEQLMTRAVGDIDYRSGEQLLAGASFIPTQQHCCEVHIVDTSGKNEEQDKTELEAQYVAEMIKNLVTSGFLVQSGDEMRPVRYGDICIVLRAVKKKARVFSAELEKLGIAASADTQGGFLRSREISAVVSLLRAIDNPLLDVDVAAAMMSPIFAFSPDEMAEIRMVNRRAPLYSCVLTASATNTHCKEFVNTVAELRFVSASSSVRELIVKIYDVTAYEAVVRMGENGEKRLQNLRLLIDYAADFEGRGYMGLTSFLRLVDRLVESGGDFAEGAISEGAAESINIMSIHKSKGLEFPVVIVCDCAKEFNEKDLNGNTLLHSELGFACIRRQKASMSQFTTVPMEAMRCKIRQENRSEEMRMLYVAATRARELLIFTGTSANLGKKLASLATNGSNLLASAGCKSYMDWLLLALLLHPDGYELRAVSGANSIIAGQKDMFKVVIGRTYKTQQAQPSAAEAVRIDMPLLQKLQAQSDFKYAHPQAVVLPAKLAISQISEMGSNSKYRFMSRPTFLYSSGMTPAERGNALHKFMQFCNYSEAAKNPTSEVLRLVESQFISKAEGESIESGQIEQFFASPLGTRIFAAKQLHREYRFLALAGKEILGKFTDMDFADNKTSVQGVADCVFVEDDGAVIVDFKTDYAKSPDELIGKYSTQLLLYAALLGEALDMPIKECIIYSFALGSEIPVAINLC